MTAILTAEVTSLTSCKTRVLQKSRWRWKY